MKIIIRNACIVNEGETKQADVLLSNNRIEQIKPIIYLENSTRFKEINAEGLYLLPGVIDDQVHFREPGLTHKANIYSESKAAVAGGITSYMDMPNTLPFTLTRELLEEKYNIASKNSFANYSFFMGISKGNLEDALRIDNEHVCGLTDDGLYFDKDHGILANCPDFLEILFSRSDSLIALHSEDEQIIERNLQKFQKQYRDNIPIECHPLIRSEEACFKATNNLLKLAKKHQNRLHLFHITTSSEAQLFNNTLPASKKRITAEACIPHLCFSSFDYQIYGSKIKWNPSVKSIQNRNGIFEALIENKLDIIATDHAPHTIEEKRGNYLKSMSGGPLVQHALPAMLEFYHENKISLETLVEKMCHNVAEIYKIQNRGYIREGYFADLTLVDLNTRWEVNSENILYKCKWTPFENKIFRSKIRKTFVNGNLVYDDGIFDESKKGNRLRFSKIR